jgi:hypothetical protein
MRTIIGRSGFYGSSPRVRGIPREPEAEVLSPRFIPAGAGNTAPPACRSNTRRFIPAGAGNTDQLRQGRHLQLVHPRGCGEYSPSSRDTEGLTTVHPRGCGEYRIALGWRTRGSGSSPRVRGIRHVHLLPDALLGSSPRVRGIRAHNPASDSVNRFIPAGAGNTASRSGPEANTSVHPRGCGEYSLGGPPGGSSAGSSPRVRGIRPRAKPRAVPHRFIPAGAGNTECCQTCYIVLPVHPRGCGEY